MPRHRHSCANWINIRPRPLPAAAAAVIPITQGGDCTGLLAGSARRLLQLLVCQQQSLYRLLEWVRKAAVGFQLHTRSRASIMRKQSAQRYPAAGSDGMLPAKGMLEHTLNTHSIPHLTHRPGKLWGCLNLHCLLAGHANNSRATRQQHACAAVHLPHNPGVCDIGVVALGAVGLQHTVHHLHKDN